MEQLYSCDFLLNRIYQKLENNTFKKFTISKPKVQLQNKKTFITNYSKLCNSINRDENLVKIFIDTELKNTSSITENGTLIINDIYKSNIIENIIFKYLQIYVICSEPKCGSGNTELIKENRILFLNCKYCNSKKAIKI